LRLTGARNSAEPRIEAAPFPIFQGASMEIASAPRERSDGVNGVFVAAWIAGCASGDDVTIQSGERREAPRKDAAIREHETPGASAFRVHVSRRPSVGLPSAAHSPD
jgi:hypothetical protein